MSKMAGRRQLQAAEAQGLHTHGVFIGHRATQVEGGSRDIGYGYKKKAAANPCGDGP